MAQVGTSKNNTEPLLVVARKGRTTTCKEKVDHKEFKKTKGEQRENEWTEKIMNGQFARDFFIQIYWHNWQKRLG